MRLHREEKKREALERSRARTENSAYFDEKKKSNDSKIKVISGGSAAESGGSGTGSNQNGSEAGAVADPFAEEGDDSEGEDDPFRSQSKKKNRNKIFVR